MSLCSRGEDRLTFNTPYVAEYRLTGTENQVAANCYPFNVAYTEENKITEGEACQLRTLIRAFR